jgi:high-affinity iron transporter
MLVTVIIFLREALEAALILSVLLAVSFQLIRSREWILPALCIGLIGGGVTANYLGEISNMFEGAGQEIMNASFLLAMVILINIICLWLSRFLFQIQACHNFLLAKYIRLIFIIYVAIAITHEGSELTIYSYSYSLAHNNILPLIIGSSLGLGIGASLGAIIYYLLISLQKQTLIKVSICILMLIAAGMASQATLYLIQSGWLPSQSPLWDTSGFIPERSVLGQLLYAFMGYEATPSLIQVSSYFAVIACCILSIFIYAKYVSPKD